MGLFFRKAPKTPSDALPKKEAQKISRILFSKSPESDPQKRVLLSLAAPMRAKSQNAADCLPSFSEKEKTRLRTMFCAQFGDLTKETLTEQIESALSFKTAEHYDALLSFAAAGDESSIETYLTRKLSGDERCFSKSPLLRAYCKRLESIGFSPNVSACAYDLCRAANFAVIGFGIDLFSEEEMYAFLSKTADCIKNRYASYQEYLSGYLLGRGCHIWLSGEFMALLSDYDQNICRVLLSDPKSPYVQLPLK